jgi:hypothetical protein
VQREQLVWVAEPSRPCKRGHSLLRTALLHSEKRRGCDDTAFPGLRFCVECALLLGPKL